MPYYLKIDGKVFGPFDSAKVRRLIESGKVGPHDWISKNGTSWSECSTVKGLFGKVTIVDPPPIETSPRPAPESDAGDGVLDVAGQATKKGAMVVARGAGLAGRAVGTVIGSIVKMRPEAKPIAERSDKPIEVSPQQQYPPAHPQQYPPAYPPPQPQYGHPPYAPPHYGYPPPPQPQTIQQNTTVIVGGQSQGNTLATSALVLSMMAVGISWVPGLGLLVFPAAGLICLVAFCGFIVSLGRKGEGLAASLLAVIFSVVAMAIASASTSAAIMTM